MMLFLLDISISFILLFSLIARFKPVLWSCINIHKIDPCGIIIFILDLYQSPISGILHDYVYCCKSNHISSEIHAIQKYRNGQFNTVLKT